MLSFLPPTRETQTDFLDPSFILIQAQVPAGHLKSKLAGGRFLLPSPSPTLPLVFPLENPALPATKSAPETQQENRKEKKPQRCPHSCAHTVSTAPQIQRRIPLSQTARVSAQHPLLLHNCCFRREALWQSWERREKNIEKKMCVFSIWQDPSCYNETQPLFLYSVANGRGKEGREGTGRGSEGMERQRI